MAGRSKSMWVVDSSLRHGGGGGNQTDRHVGKIQVTGMCVPCALSRAGPGYRPATELTDSPHGTEQESDDVTECHTSGDHFCGPVARGRGPRAAPPDAVYIGVQMLEKHPKNCHFRHFSGTSGAACRREGSLGKALQHHEIGHDPCSAGPSQNRVGIGAPKLPYRIPLIVHYPMWFTRHRLAIQGNSSTSQGLWRSGQADTRRIREVRLVGWSDSRLLLAGQSYGENRVASKGFTNSGAIAR